MNIVWAENPLLTTIEVDERDKEKLFLAIKCEQLIERLFSAHYSIAYSKKATVQSLAEIVDCVHYLDSGGVNPLDDHCKMLVDEYVDALRGPHCGDCTCVPCSCIKCHAEALFDVDTIAGLGKHQAYKVASAFSRGTDRDGNWLPERSIGDAIVWLDNYKVDPSKYDLAEWGNHIERWQREAIDAAAWLRAYRDKYFPENK